MTVTSDSSAQIRCESRGGNPAAILKWFIDEEELEDIGYDQKNETDVGDKRLWNAVSLLDYTFKKVKQIPLI